MNNVPELHFYSQQISSFKKKNDVNFTAINLSINQFISDFEISFSQIYSLLLEYLFYEVPHYSIKSLKSNHDAYFMAIKLFLIFEFV
jgi:hypothetical protein